MDDAIKPSSSPSWRSSAFMLSDVMDAVEYIQNSGRDYAPESRREYYDAVITEIKKLADEEKETHAQ